jgi:hypothetical protein
MTYRGYVKNGVIVLEDAAALPEGTKVQVEPLPEPGAETGEEEIPSLYEQIEPVVGKATTLPPDASINHDHYLYGLPKKQ